MTQPSLWDQPVRTVADTSLDAYRERVLPTLSENERAVFVALCVFCEGWPDATGGELATFMGTRDTRTRPRLHGLERKGWIEKTPARMSRAYPEGKCHGYRPVVPRAAVERIKTTT